MSESYLPSAPFAQIRARPLCCLLSAILAGKLLSSFEVHQSDTPD